MRCNVNGIERLNKKFFKNFLCLKVLNFREFQTIDSLSTVCKSQGMTFRFKEIDLVARMVLKSLIYKVSLNGKKN